ncbi:MAG: hypothetical protein B7Z82_05715 [Halothiobacillus sp. 20-54-6]|nr:MAG: hypothetical protein B7Z82_05715 [Halothiobacillus sp. 20-54-6]
MMDSVEVIKAREIGFRGPHHHGDQATGACAFAVHLPGVQCAARKHAACMQVEYDLQQICLRVLRRHLQLAGFHLDASLLNKLKVALIEYAEENQREELGLGNCAMPNQAFRPTVDQLAVSGRFTHPPTPPERSDDPWRHYL